MTSLLVHTKTLKIIESFIENPAHALLLVGPKGIGKTELAKKIISDILEDNKDFNLKIVEPIKNSISIEEIRGLREFLRLKTSGAKAFRRSVIIKDADSMTEEAQNAVLKILEEPPNDTIIILTAQSDHALLQTITSRVTLINVLTPSLHMVLDYFMSQGIDKSRIEKYYALTKGMPGSMTQLFNGDENDEYLKAVGIAKKVLGASRFERLLMVADLSTNKESTLNLLKALQRIAIATIDLSAAKTNPSQIRRWYRVLRVSYDAEDMFNKNVNARLILMNLFLSL